MGGFGADGTTEDPIPSSSNASVYTSGDELSENGFSVIVIWITMARLMKAQLIIDVYSLGSCMSRTIDEITACPENPTEAANKYPVRAVDRGGWLLRPWMDRPDAISMLTQGILGTIR